jgi:hypothetical protein
MNALVRNWELAMDTVCVQDVIVRARPANAVTRSKRENFADFSNLKAVEGATSLLGDHDGVMDDFLFDMISD